jgi:hypothetical protein
VDGFGSRSLIAPRLLSAAPCRKGNLAAADASIWASRQIFGAAAVLVAHEYNKRTA